MCNAGDCFLGFFLKVKYSIYIIFTFFWQLFDVICQGVSKWQPCSQTLQENIKKQYFRILCIYPPPLLQQPLPYLHVAVVCVPVQTYAAIHICTGVGRGLAPPFTFFRKYTCIHTVHVI